MKYEIEIEAGAVLVEIKQYDKKGEMIATQIISVPKNGKRRIIPKSVHMNATQKEFDMKVLLAIVKWLAALVLGWLGAFGASYVLAAVAVSKYGFVQLPDADVTIINGLVIAVVGFALSYLITLIPFLNFLSQYAEPFGLAISAALVNAFQNAVPDQFAGAAVLGVEFVLSLLALYQFIHLIKKNGVMRLMGGMSGNFGGPPKVAGDRSK